MRCGPLTGSTSSSPRRKASATASPRKAASRRRPSSGCSRLRDRDRDPGNRDIDNEAQGLAAQAEARRTDAGQAPAEVRIDWGGIAAARKAADGSRQRDWFAHARARRSIRRVDDRHSGRRRWRWRPGWRRRRDVHHQRRERPVDARAERAAEHRRRRRQPGRWWWRVRRRSGLRLCPRRPHAVFPIGQRIEQRPVRRGDQPAGQPECGRRPRRPRRCGAWRSAG